VWITDLLFKYIKGNKMKLKKSLASILGATFFAASMAGNVYAQAKPALTEIKVSYQPALYWALPFYVATEKIGGVNWV
jgi:NitT/TauT family transport system substrate-binding protein